jgi:hypothetical protein
VRKGTGFVGVGYLIALCRLKSGVSRGGGVESRNSMAATWVTPQYKTTIFHGCHEDQGIDVDNPLTSLDNPFPRIKVFHTDYNWYLVSFYFESNI